MDISPFMLDIDELINEFSEAENTSLEDMKRMWLSRKFSYIYEARPSTNSSFFMQSLYTHTIGDVRVVDLNIGGKFLLYGHMLSGASLSHKLGGLYCLYCLYETQPFKPLFRIYLSTGELRHLKEVVVMAKEKDLKEPTAVVKKMLKNNVFLFGFVDKNEGCMAERINELTGQENVFVGVAYKKLLEKTRIDDFIHMDMAKELGVDEIKKISTDYAKVKELAIREASAVVDVKNIEHISGSEKLIGHAIEDISVDWSKQKEGFYEQISFNQSHSDQRQAELKGLLELNQSKSDEQQMEDEDHSDEWDNLLSTF